MKAKSKTASKQSAATVAHGPEDATAPRRTPGEIGGVSGEGSASPGTTTDDGADHEGTDGGSSKGHDTAAAAAAAASLALPDTDIRNSAPVARIMKNALPENAKIAKEAKECMQECVSEFISFITSEGTKSPSRFQCA